MARIYAPPSRLIPLVVGAIAGGIAAGLGMLLLVGLAYLAGDPLAPLNAIGAWAVRWLQTADADALTGFYYDATLGGAAIAVVVGGIVGALFASIMDRLPQDHPVAWGVMTGLVLWAISWFKILPALDPVLVREIPRLHWLAAMLAFGVVLGSWIELDRRAQPVLGESLRAG